MWTGFNTQGAHNHPGAVGTGVVVAGGLGRGGGAAQRAAVPST